MNILTRRYSSAVPALVLAVFTCLFAQPVVASTVVVTPPAYHSLQNPS